MSQQTPIRIAISGGGLAGACLIHALLGQTNLDVHIFESASTFKEAGAAIGIVRNARRALKLIGPSALRCLERAGAVPLQGVRWIMARGEDKGKEIDRIDAKDQPITNIVHRADFLRELLADVPPSRLHASKKLEKIEEDGEGGPVVLTYSDGTRHECDVLIGADGIRSNVREYVLGKDDEAAHPVASGLWFVQALRPYEEGLAALGQDFVDLQYPVEFDYAGDGCWWMHNFLSDGNTAQSVVCVKCDPGDVEKNWIRMIFPEEIRERCREWPDPIKEGVEKLILAPKESSAPAPKELKSFYIWEHPPASNYVKSSVGIIGDAAHTTSPWMSSGVGMSIEDALVLSNVLACAQSPAEARVALKVYDSLRRPRTQEVIANSHGTGDFLTAVKADFDLNSLAEMKKNLSPRWNFIRYFDSTNHRNNALRMMKEELARAKLV